jgi:kumamolisin
LTGAGQTVALAEFDGYYPADISNYEAQCGEASVTLTNVLLNGVSGIPGFSHEANAVAEVSLDIELAIAMAPGLSGVVVYEGSNPYTVFNRIATDDLAAQISCSWLIDIGPRFNLSGTNSTLDSILKELVAQGQAVFQASGDGDAYTGNASLSPATGPIPVDSPYLTSVGGTSLTMSGSGAAWASESVWNWGNGQGSGGGVSSNYAIPWWQTNVSMAANNGSTIRRNLPDVALTADAVYVIHDNGSSGYYGGTSCAAPLWAGFCALVNQQAVASGQVTFSVGFLNPALYGLAAGANYPACFHDVTAGNNIGANTAGLYYAVPGYDLCTGLGTPNGANLINALAPPLGIVAEPTNATVAAGNCAVFTVTAFGLPPVSYAWQCNGTNIPGATAASYSRCNVQPADSGTLFTCIVSDGSGWETTVAATLTVTGGDEVADAPLLPPWGILILFAGILGVGAGLVPKSPVRAK